MWRTISLNSLTEVVSAFADVVKVRHPFFFFPFVAIAHQWLPWDCSLPENFPASKVLRPSLCHVPVTVPRAAHLCNDNCMKWSNLKSHYRATVARELRWEVTNWPAAQAAVVWNQYLCQRHAYTVGLATTDGRMGASLWITNKKQVLKGGCRQTTPQIGFLVTNQCLTLKNFTLVCHHPALHHQHFILVMMMTASAAQSWSGRKFYS